MALAPMHGPSSWRGTEVVLTDGLEAAFVAGGPPSPPCFPRQDIRLPKMVQLSVPLLQLLAVYLGQLQCCWGLMVIGSSGPALKVELWEGLFLRHRGRLLPLGETSTKMIQDKEVSGICAQLSVGLRWSARQRQCEA
ncbi:unnamed protein product [Durusdinium trenchii]|uniref:Uncharacterized protein n=1 Tax=Durusdinium trenchii TaxID=1381693 RepID=A0ABP0N534_9DINO